MSGSDGVPRPGRSASRLIPAGAALALVFALGCSRHDDSVRGSGTIEMDETDVSSMIGGRIVRLAVEEGDTVRAGDTLAVLDRGEITAELGAQAAEAQRAKSQARDLAAGARPAEVLTAQAQLDAARVDERLAQSEFARIEKLARSGAVAQLDLDRARAARDAAAARTRVASEQLRLQEEGARRQAIAAANQAATAAAAQLAGARSRAGELVLIAPIDGVVLVREYDPGEVAMPGSPVVTLGDPGRLWMRVYVAAPLLSSIRLGAAVEVSPIGARAPFPGRVASIASQAEFTPRAALTEEEQANLVFGVRIALDPSGGALKSGLPADARIRIGK